VVDRRPPASIEPLVAAGREPRTPHGTGPVELAERREARQQLADGLLTLAPSVREAVVLRHVDGLSVAETAAALGRPEGTVKAQVHRGLAALRAHLAPDFLDLTTASKELTA
jgi:RNA polymerase sigma-70 factor (ECF subfamily)